MRSVVLLIVVVLLGLLGIGCCSCCCVVGLLCPNFPHYLDILSNISIARENLTPSAKIEDEVVEKLIQNLREKLDNTKISQNDEEAEENEEPAVEEELQSDSMCPLLHAHTAPSHLATIIWRKKKLGGKLAIY